MYVDANPLRFIDPLELEAVPMAPGALGGGLGPIGAYAPGTPLNDAFVESTTRLLGVLSSPFNDDDVGTIDDWLNPENPHTRDDLICEVRKDTFKPPEDICTAQLKERLKRCRTMTCKVWAQLMYRICKRANSRNGGGGGDGGGDDGFEQ